MTTAIALATATAIETGQTMRTAIQTSFAAELSTLLLLVSTAASGQQPPVVETVSYDYAEVLRADPIYQRVIYSEPEQHCDDEAVYQRVEPRRRGNGAGAVLGAIIGGAVGNQIGSGSGRVAATVGGAVVGGAIGNRAGQHDRDRYEPVEEVRPGCRIVEVERESRELIGYEVEYRHKGEVYISRLKNDPGHRLQVRVAISPVDEPGYPDDRSLPGR